MKNLNNLHMTTNDSSMISVSWEDDAGNRHHAWLEVEGGKPVSPYRIRTERAGLSGATAKQTVYRNPPEGVERRHPGFFKTRYLDAAASANAVLVAEALRRAEAEGMFEAALSRAETEARDRDAAQRAGKAAKMREQLFDRRTRLDGRPQADEAIGLLLALSDADLLTFCHLG